MERELGDIEKELQRLNNDYNIKSNDLQNLLHQFEIVGENENIIKDLR